MMYTAAEQLDALLDLAPYGTFVPTERAIVDCAGGTR